MAGPVIAACRLALGPAATRCAARRAVARVRSLSTAGPIFTSTFPDVDMPNVPLSEYVLGHVDRHDPSAPALVDGASGRALSYGELRPTVEAFAAGLHHACELRHGDVLAILLPNCPEYFVAFQAAASRGIVLTTLNPLYTPEEVGAQLSDSKAKYILTVGALVGPAREAAALAGGGVRGLITLDDSGAEAGELRALTYASVMAAGSDAAARAALPPVSVAPSDLLVLPYSSGTSGRSKGVKLTHRNVLANLLQIDPLLVLSPKDTVLGLLPFFHIYGMVVVLKACITHGCKIVTMPKFDPELFLKLIAECNFTVMHLAPPLVQFLAKHPAVEAVLPQLRASLREIVSGAAPLGEELAHAAKERLSCPLVRQGYGMTEMSPVSHLSPPHGLPDEKLGAAGMLLPSMSAKIVGEGGELLGVGETGELVMKGPNVMQGYLELPEATAECLDDDGWLRTGDIGYVDADGYYFVNDRVKELIKTKGFQACRREMRAPRACCRCETGLPGVNHRHGPPHINAGGARRA